MKRGVTSALLLLLLSVQLMAQRGMAGGFGGHSGHFSGGGGFVRGRPFGVPRMGVAPRFGVRGGVFIGPPRGIIIGHTGFGIAVRSGPHGFGRFHHNRRFFPRSFPNRFCSQNPFACNGAWGFNPWFGGGVGYWSGYALPYGAYYSGTANDEVQATLAQQQTMIADLEEQVRQERLNRMQADAAQPAPAPPVSEQSKTEPPISPTVLVFRDQNRVEVRNYAIMGNTLYEFAPNWNRKIALADLDVPATVRANEERGVEFRVPTSKAEVVTHP